MPNLTSVGITAGVPNSGTGTVSTLDNLLGTAGTPNANVQTVQGVSGGTALPAGGDVANGSSDSGNPVKVGGRAGISVPTPVTDGQRANAWFDKFGRQTIADIDPDLNVATGLTSLRDKIVAQRYTVLADSVADGLAGFWTTTTASGGTVTVSGGEGLIQTSTATTGSAQIGSPAPSYFPGQVTWFNSAIRVGDTGTAGCIRRWGAYTTSGTTPQEGFYYELNGTTFNAVVVKAGSATATAVGSWSLNSTNPFTLDTNYHSFEIRWTANYVGFYIDNVLRHTVAGTTTPITSTLNFPMQLTNVKTSGSTNLVLAVRNCGIGRFGTPPTQYTLDNTVTPTVTASAYSSGNVIGGIMTFPAVLDPGAFNGVLQSITAKFKASAVTGNLEVAIFKASPSNGTYTDKTAPTWNYADMANLLGIYTLTSVSSKLGTMTIYNLDAIGKAIVGSSQALYAVVVVDGTPTPASTSDFTLELAVLPG